MRCRIIIALSLTALAHAAVSAKAGPEFTALAAGAAGTVERIDMTSVPTWQSGDFRLGNDGTVGHVRRRARGASYGAPALDPTERDRDGFAEIERTGSLRFTLNGPSANGPSAGGGALTGECNFDRLEQRLTLGSLTLADPAVPLALDCRYWRGGAEVGTLRLEGVVRSRGVVQRTARVGQVTAAGSTLTIRSLHKLGRLGIKSETPVGYAFSSAGRDVGAVDITAASKRRLALPRDPVQRDAALAAGVTLGLLWDPGDTDD